MVRKFIKYILISDSINMVILFTTFFSDKFYLLKNL